MSKSSEVEQKIKSLFEKDMALEGKHRFLSIYLKQYAMLAVEEAEEEMKAGLEDHFKSVIGEMLEDDNTGKVSSFIFEQATVASALEAWRGENVRICVIDSGVSDCKVGAVGKDFVLVEVDGSGTVMIPLDKITSVVADFGKEA